jgi:hypothetical protein
MSDKQENFIRTLIEDRALSDEDRVKAYEQLANGLSMRKASAWIERLLTYPMRPKVGGKPVEPGKVAVPTPEQLPAGRYAIEDTDEDSDNDLVFYRVWRGTRNPGFVKLYLLHGPDSTELSFKASLTIMQKIIDAGIHAAAIRYGREIGACSQCGRRLTNRLSRHLGIGPVCGGRTFQDDNQWKNIVNAGRANLKSQGLDPNENVED